MEQNFNPTPVNVESPANPFFKKALVVIILLLAIIVLILAGLGWYVKSQYQSSVLTDEEIANLTKPASTTPLTDKERKEIVKTPEKVIPLTAEERTNLLKN